MDRCEPQYSCSICPRLRAYIDEQKTKYPDWHNGPVATFTPKKGIHTAKLLIIGLAPGLKGANRTGRPFTGDYAGDLLYKTLAKFGFTKGDFDTNGNDELELIDAAITNAVRCVPPQNKPVGGEIQNCRPFLNATINSMENARVLLTLGKISHDSTVRTLGGRLRDHPFGHANKTTVDQWTVFSSYHCSRYNTNTGRLTENMFDDVFGAIRAHLDKAD